MSKVAWSGDKKVRKSGVFIVTFEHPEFVERGHTARFQAMFEHVNDGLIDPTSPTLKTYEGSTLKDTLTPTKDSQGIYYHDYTVPATSKTGEWFFEWSGTYSGKSILAGGGFKVSKTVR